MLFESDQADFGCPDGQSGQLGRKNTLIRRSGQIFENGG